MNLIREKLESAQIPALLSITRCFRITDTATAVQVQTGALPLDLQVEKEYLLMHVFRLKRDLDNIPIYFSSDEIHIGIVKFIYHPATSWVID